MLQAFLLGQYTLTVAGHALPPCPRRRAAADPNVFQSYLLYHRRFRALCAANREDEARSALAQSLDEFTALLESLSPEQREHSRTAIPAHRVLLAIGTVANSWRLSLLVDNVSLKVSGSQEAPNFAGEIGFIDGHQIKRINPNSGAAQTIWTHQETGGQIHRVRWNPTATELTFASNHEQFYSSSMSDLYGRHADGSGLRRITNAPSQADILAGSYPKGNVRLSIHNDYNEPTDNVSTFTIYVQGAAELISIPLPAYGDSAQVLVQNVARLDDSQYIVFIYSSNKCGSNRRYVPNFVSVTPGQTVDLSLSFNGTGCAGFRPQTTHATWKRDGSEIGYITTNSPFKTAATGASDPGQSWWSSASAIGVVDWSPVDDQVIFDVAGLVFGIAIRNDAEPNGESAMIVTKRNSVTSSPDTPIWLPDGSGFLFKDESDIFYASAQG
jgi:hypothetical protein